MAEYHIVVLAFVIGEHAPVEYRLVDVRIQERRIEVQLRLTGHARPRLRRVCVSDLE